MTEPIGVVVVAGGKSVRLGQDKRRLQLWGADGPTLLEHTLEIVRRYSDDVVVVLNDPANWKGLDATIVADALPDSGVLGGIYTGLSAVANEYVLVVAGDMPFLNAGLIDWMVAQPRTYDVLVPRVGDGKARNRLGVESLHAIYRTSCREPIRQQIEQGNPQVIGFFPQVNVQFVAPDVVSSFDPQGIAFMNVNTPEDIDNVTRIIARDAHV